MYNWAIAFIVMSLAAAVFALGGFGAPYDQLGALLCPLFLALSAVAAVMGKRTRHRQ